MRLFPKTHVAMLRAGLLVLALVSVISWSCSRSVATKVRYVPQVGDVLFQSLPNPPGLDIIDAIEGATESPYSHCGVVVEKNGKMFVLEAMVPRVRETPYERWIERGRSRFAVFRLKEEHHPQIPEWIAEMRKRIGKRYDFRYRMSDEEIYCSELPFDGWKSLTGQNMGTVVKLGSLKWEKYREVIQKIEGSEEVPLEREMITPRDLAAAPQLELIVNHGL